MLSHTTSTGETPSSPELKPLRLKYQCCIPKCPSKYYGRIEDSKNVNKKRFHMFPRNPYERTCWLKNIKRTTGKEIPWNTHMRVCSDHFTSKWTKKPSSAFTKSGRLVNANLTLFPLEVDEYDFISRFPSTTNERISRGLDLSAKEETSDYFLKIDQCYQHEMAARRRANIPDRDQYHIEPIVNHQFQDSSLMDHDYCIKKKQPVTSKDSLYDLKIILPPVNVMANANTIISVIDFNLFKNVLHASSSNTSLVSLSNTENNVEEEPFETQIENDFCQDKSHNAFEEYRNTKRKRFVKRSNAFKERLKTKLSQRQYKFIESYVNHMGCCKMNIFTKKQVFSLMKRPKTKGFSVENFKKTIILPSGSSLMALLLKMPLDSGIDSLVFNRLAEKVKIMNSDEKFCVLMFHTVPLLRKVGSDKICGRSKLINCDTASHALVFMIQGLKKLWQQPVAYCFMKNKGQIEYIKYLLVQVVSKLQEVGLTVIATICKHSLNNRRALSNLSKKTNSNFHSEPYFLVNRLKIFTIYDPSTLLLATRNILLSYNIEFEPQKFACIDHVRRAFDMDKNRLLPRLSKIRQKYLKLRRYDLLRLNVNVAAETFSYPVASCIEDCLGNGGVDTSEFIYQINLLFHSLNSNNKSLQGRRFLKTSLSNWPSHLLFWNKTIPWIQKWAFHNKNNDTIKYNMPTKHCWLTTISATKLLWQTYKKNCLKTNSLNLDPLQNFFASLQYIGTKNRRLSKYEFSAAYKLSLLNNLTVSCDIKSNGGREKGFLLDNYQDLFNTTSDNLF